MAFSERRIFAAGAAHIDRLGRPSGRFRPLASNPGTVTASAGGAIYKAALALRRCGAAVALMSGRGGDADGAAVAAALKAAGIDDLAMTWLDRQSPNFTAILDDHEDFVVGIADMQLYDLLSGRVFSRRHIREAMSRCDALILDANLPPSGIGYLVETFRGRPIAAIGVSPAKAVRLAPRLGDMSMLFLSRAEAAELVDWPSTTGIVRLAQLLAEAGALRAVITDGADAVAILEAGRLWLQEASPIIPFGNIAGARDALAGVTALAHTDGRPFVEAVRLGIAAAAHQDRTQTAGDDLDDIERVAAAMPPPRPAG